MIALNRRRVAGGESLPYDSEIEYLQSSGTQYINLPFGFYNTDTVEIRGAMVQVWADNYVLAPSVWNDNNNRFGIMGTINDECYFCVCYGNKSTYYSRFSRVWDNNVHLWTYANKTFTVADLGLRLYVGSGWSFGRETKNLRLFYGYQKPTTHRVYYYKHTKKGVLVADLIPVRVGNVGYMYDRVSMQLYGNSGTGKFILGGDI